MLSAAVLAILGLIVGGGNAKPPSRIAGGSYAYVGEFKYQVMLMSEDNPICGGAIISERHILTAGHCLDNELVERYSAVAGVTNVKDPRARRFRVAKVVRHPNYIPYRKGYSNVERDIEIIVLADKIPLGGDLLKVNIPIYPSKPGDHARLAGWGLIKSDSQMSPDLKKLDVTLLDEETCFKKRGFVTDDRLCGYNPSGTLCGGDSGSPLISEGYVIGIASASFCIPGDGHAYTNVYHYRQWILDVMQST